MFLNSEIDNPWPCEKIQIESDSYPYPYQIQNYWEWSVKGEQEIEETFDDNDNVKFKIQNEYKITMKKPEIDFEPN